jgi:hypothetical protein
MASTIRYPTILQVDLEVQQSCDANSARYDISNGRSFDKARAPSSDSLHASCMSKTSLQICPPRQPRYIVHVPLPTGLALPSYLLALSGCCPHCTYRRWPVCRCLYSIMGGISSGDMKASRSACTATDTGVNMSSTAAQQSSNVSTGTCMACVSSWTTRSV